jgi:large subunit ribosomal protein L17
MRHRKAGRRLGRNSGQRKALMRSLAHALFQNGRIRTTDQKCKELRPMAEKIITIAKRGLVETGREEGDSEAAARVLHARRRLLRILPNPRVVSRILDEVAPQFRDRPGGYIRIVKVGPRHGDNAPTSIIELVERVSESST